MIPLLWIAGGLLAEEWWQGAHGKAGILGLGHYFQGKKSVVTKLTARSSYALNVLADPTVLDPATVLNAIVAAQQGAFFAAGAQSPKLVQEVSTWPGIELGPFGGKANQWIVYVTAKKTITLPYQPAPTLIITGGYLT